MTTILPYFFVFRIDRFDDLPDIPLPGNSCLVYTLSKETLPFIDPFYKKIFTTGTDRHFCLLIEPDSDSSNDPTCLETIMDFIISVSFHYRYLKLNSGNPLILFRKTTPDAGIHIPRYRQALLSQGYEQIDCLVIEGRNVFSWPRNEKKGICFGPEMAPELLIPACTEAIMMIGSADLCLFFEMNTPVELPKLLETLGAAEEKIRNEYSLLYHLLKESRDLLDRQQELHIKFGMLREQLDSKNSYHSPTHPATAYLTNQIKAITEFYKYEYEILPLWFKRLGHILKVLMGKRTLKSLFNDNVKKYKV